MDQAEQQTPWAECRRGQAGCRGVGGRVMRSAVNCCCPCIPQSDIVMLHCSSSRLLPLNLPIEPLFGLQLPSIPHSANFLELLSEIVRRQGAFE